MELLKSLLILVAVVCIGFILLGLYKPSLVVWWEDIQNRKKVLKIYGTGSILFFILYIALNYWLANQ